MIYGIIRCELDEYFAFGARWIADPESLRLFSSRKVRDAVLDGLEDGCESYESYTPFECRVEDVESARRDVLGRFLRKDQK